MRYQKTIHTVRRRFVRVALPVSIALTSASVAPAALVAHYKMDETEGSTLVDAQSGFDGTYNGSVDLSQSGVSGGAVLFDPRGEDATVPYQASLNTQTFSVSFWFNNPTADGTGGDNREGMVGTIRNNYPSYTDGWSVGMDNQGRIVTQIGKPGGSAGWFGPATDTGVVGTGEWYHVVLTHDAALDGGTTKIYVNGVEESSTTGQAFSPTTGSSPLSIGHDGNGSNFEYSGYIDDVQLYDNALSALDTSLLYGQPGLSLSEISAVPEPASTALLAMFLGSGLFFRSRRRD